LRSNSTRARALVAAGVLGSTMSAPAALAQTEAPSAAPLAPSRLTVSAKRLNVRAGRVAAVRGVLRPRAASRIVRLETLRGGRWRQLDADVTSRSGRFVVRYRPRSAGSSLVRVRFGGGAGAGASHRVVGRLNAFRPAVASWYGPGLYGNRLGCGGTLTPGTIGVAHKYLPCGTTVVLRHGSHVVRARVVDRGPYVGGREFDLTAATKQRLGFGSVGTVWVAH
jgi:peptidoglycan lytic transglycosylase